jgi:hypothetical protein
MQILIKGYECWHWVIEHNVEQYLLTLIKEDSIS